jgi:phosphohistidine swiveling domain-containing protein
VFTNSAGSATSTAATLSVNAKPEAPKVTANPADKAVAASEGATFTAAASGYPAPKVQWQVSVNGGGTFTNDTGDAGNATGTLSVSATTTAMSGREYRAVFTNTSGTATSSAAMLTVSSGVPVVTGLNPNSGSANSLILISGKNFTNTQAVYFGSQSVGGWVLSSTELLVLVPAGSGTVDVTVKTPSGTSAKSTADRFTYVAARRG